MQSKPTSRSARFLALSPLIVLTALTGAQERERQRPEGAAPFSLGSSEAAATTTAARYFAICDYDGNGWITFSEASLSLSIDRNTFFRIYDQERDGLISPEEFERAYMRVVRRGGVFREPTSAPTSGPDSLRSPEDLREVYDIDLDGTLSLSEIDSILEDYQLTRLGTEKVLEDADADFSGHLDLEEIQELARVISPQARIEQRRAQEPEQEKKDLMSLFGLPLERGGEPGSTQQPARIRGPISHFRRLDIDADGKITASDLKHLQRPLYLPVKINVVISYLDTDGDGGLSPREFFGSMLD